MNQNIILSPLVSEKAMQGSDLSKYTLLVARRATKKDIKRAIAEAFKVHVVNVQTITVKGRTQRVGQKRVEVRQPEFKKAIVRLKKGEKIDLFEPGGAEGDKKKKK